MQNSNHKHRLIAPATLKFFKAGIKANDYSLWDMIHGYVYARWPYLYIGIAKGEHPVVNKITPVMKFWSRIFPKPSKPTTSKHSLELASNTIADGYHGKVSPLETAKNLIMVQEPIRVNDLEQIIPYVRARAILQENPEHIVVLECPCRSVKENPCLPLDVCMVIGEPFASFVIEHHPNKSRWITQQEAVEILEAEDARGHVHHAFFKDAMLGRFYAICNCCSCCCGAMHAHQHGTPMLESSGYTAFVNEDICVGCDTCSEYCQFNALVIKEGHGWVDQELCMGCGVCVSKCPEGAISLNLAPEKGIPLEIQSLIEHAASME
jgi:Pyruvate/2-oxoacid:ferredoxin oxidoreductase delta subunit